MHIFEADGAAVIGTQHLNYFTHGRLPETEHAAQINGAIQRLARETVIFRGELGRYLALGKAERIEIGSEVAAHTIGADQHHRADRIVRRLLDLRRRLAVGSCRRLHLAGNDRQAHLRRIEPRIDVVERDRRPA